MTGQFRAFSIARMPRIRFGSGAFAQVAETAAGYGRRVLLVTGARSFQASGKWQQLLTQLEALHLSFDHVCIPGEPSPEVVDDAVKACAGKEIDVVVGIGGGSAMDAAKAIAGLIDVKVSVMDFLEGVGPELPY